MNKTTLSIIILVFLVSSGCVNIKITSSPDGAEVFTSSTLSVEGVSTKKKTPANLSMMNTGPFYKVMWPDSTFSDWEKTGLLPASRTLHFTKKTIVPVAEKTADEKTVTKKVVTKRVTTKKVLTEKTVSKKKATKKSTGEKTAAKALFHGHNGISFEMTREQVESLGFFCVSPHDGKVGTTAECLNMEMTGFAFDLPTKNYEISIGTSNKVDRIKADFSGQFTAAEYSSLCSKIAGLFPIKDEKASYHIEDLGSRDVWISTNNVKAVLVLFFLTPPQDGSSLSISFWSPRRGLGFVE